MCDDVSAELENINHLTLRFNTTEAGQTCRCTIEPVEKSGIFDFLETISFLDTFLMQECAVLVRTRIANSRSETHDIKADSYHVSHTAAVQSLSYEFRSCCDVRLRAGGSISLTGTYKVYLYLAVVTATTCT